MNNIRAYEKRQKSAYLLILLLSIVAAWLSKLTHLGLDEYVNIPVAKLMNKVSGKNNHELYFLIMYISFPFLARSTIKNSKTLLHSRDKLKPNQKAIAFMVLVGAMSFVAYMCYFVSPNYRIGGGRFSLILSLVSKSWISLGILYGLLFISGSVFLSMFVALINRINKEMPNGR